MDGEMVQKFDIIKIVQVLEVDQYAERFNKFTDIYL